MDHDQAMARLADLSNEASTLEQPRGESFVQWHHTARGLLARALGANHSLVTAWDEVRYLPRINGSSAASFRLGIESAKAILRAAQNELDMAAGDATPNGRATDPELLEHVATEVGAEEWSKAAREAAVFTEDRIRRWTGQPDGIVFKDIAINAFGAKGNFRMGRTPGEMDGWQPYAQGLAGAVRNVDAHRIQKRDDLKQYALGVIGTPSLLLTQLRYEHGNRFSDESPVTQTEG